jgi:hypothetical protein
MAKATLNRQTVAPTTFDPTKPVQTRDGHKARIICTDANLKALPDLPVIAAVSTEEGEVLYYRKADGAHSSLRQHDLVNIPEVSVPTVTLELSLEEAFRLAYLTGYSIGTLDVCDVYSQLCDLGINFNGRDGLRPDKYFDVSKLLEAYPSLVSKFMETYKEN